ncbi:MAG: hypothetical protein SFZ03_05410 [Candidatus Melainabacteria bacterium]|nr:hypothetical protein [Candidatus Melainabacteria bacterium]
MDLITTFSSGVVQKALDGLAKRHTAIASNLANAETPNFHHRDVRFEGQLQQAILSHQKQQLANTASTPSSVSGWHSATASMPLADNDMPLAMNTTQPEHFNPNPSIHDLSDVQPEMVTETDFKSRNDGNGVDVETEMVSLARNTQRYLALTNLQGRMSRTLRGVITSGS